jgi:Tol biopolymer transport system component
MTPTSEPTPAPKPPLLAYVRVMADDSANIVLHDAALKKDEILTHFAEPENMSDVTWSRDGEWVVFVSAHDYIHSRNNERNVFMVRRDGTELQMVTGEYMDPSVALGPFVILKGRVVGADGPCVVCAQGAASPVSSDRDGAFELPGVPISSTWVRAVCQREGYALQGDVPLTATAESLLPVTITVEAKGQGSTQASLSRDGRTLAGTFYRWTLDKEGKMQYQMQGVLQDRHGVQLGTLDLPADTTLMGLDWSPTEDRLVGALTGPKSASLWLWGASGTSLGALVQITNTEQEILSAANPVWSPDGTLVAFDLRRWYWWGENKRKTELMVVSSRGQDMRALVQTDWGTVANHASWMADGKGLYFQKAEDSIGVDYWTPTGGDLWTVSVLPGATPMPWTQDGLSYLPAVSPPDRATP